MSSLVNSSLIPLPPAMHWLCCIFSVLLLLFCFCWGGFMFSCIYFFLFVPTAWYFYRIFTVLSGDIFSFSYFVCVRIYFCVFVFMLFWRKIIRTFFPLLPCNWPFHLTYLGRCGRPNVVQRVILFLHCLQLHFILTCIFLILLVFLFLWSIQSFSCVSCWMAWGPVFLVYPFNPNTK